MEDFERSFFYYNQSRLVSKFTLNHPVMTFALLGMAKSAQKRDLNEESIIFLKKALQYAWHNKQEDLEIEIFDLLGLNNFYLGNIKNAYYFHTRYSQGSLEA